MSGDDFSTPLMYRDIGSMSMTPMAMPFGMGVAGGAGMYPSYLGGQVNMHSQPDADKYVAMKRKDDDSKKSMKTALKVFGVLMAITFAGPVFKGIKKAGGLGKYLTKQWDGMKTFLGFGSKKTSFWKRLCKK